MGRPAPKILLSTFSDKYKELQVLAATTYYYVVYKNQPFNLLEIDTDPYKAYTKKRYVTNGWSNQGHAIVLANKLNTIYDTEDFTVTSIKGE
jgi:hypothetical protein